MINIFKVCITTFGKYVIFVCVYFLQFHLNTNIYLYLQLKINVELKKKQL